MTESEGGAEEVRNIRPIIGAVVAPLGALVMYAAGVLAFNLRNGTLPTYELNFLVEHAVHSTFLNPLLLCGVYGFEMIVGLPIHVYLQKRGLTSFLTYLLAGMLVVVVPAAAVWSVVVGRGGVLLSIATLGPLSLTWAAIFWLIARPDRITPSI